MFGTFLELATEFGSFVVIKVGWVVFAGDLSFGHGSLCLLLLLLFCELFVGLIVLLFEDEKVQVDCGEIRFVGVEKFEENDEKKYTALVLSCFYVILFICLAG